jgi:hypothetical protein
MRHGSGNRRQRNRGGSSNNNGNNNHRRGGPPNRSQVFDSNGPDVRIRGTAHQIVEKYIALAKDARSSGDQSLAENYLQHAEHYQRIIGTWDSETRERESSQVDEDEEMDTAEEAADNERQAPRPPRRHKPVRTQNEDLGLPASILTAAPVSEKKKSEKKSEAV